MSTNISSMLTRNRLRFGDKIAVVSNGERLTYEELDDRVSALAASLSDLGLGRGDIVAILAENSLRYLIEVLALSRLGAISQPLNWRYHPTELVYVIRHSGAVAAFVDGDLMDVAKAILDQVDAVSHVVVHGVDTAPPGWVRVEDLEAAGAGRRVDDADVSLDDVQRILYTSGTTGHPKGVALSHGNVLWNHLGQIIELGLDSSDRVLASSPFFHVGGLDIPGLAMLNIGATLVICSARDESRIAELIEREQITGMLLPPLIARRVLDLPTEHDLTSLGWVIAGSYPDETVERLRGRVPGLRVITSYGMTELCNGIAYLDEAHQFTKRGSIGTPFPHVDIRIVDDLGEAVGVNEVGELHVRGPKVFSGYWNEPEATRAAFDGDWFRTGDYVRRDEDSYLWFVDRKKDMIKSGGENVASVEVERVLLTHPDVVEAAVVGHPDETWTQVVVAFVEVSKGSSVTSVDIEQHCRQNLGGFKIPKRIHIVDALPRSDVGKILKRELRDPSAFAEGKVH